MFSTNKKPPFGALPLAATLDLAQPSSANNSSFQQSPFGNSAEVTKFSVGAPIFGTPQQPGGNLPLNSPGLLFGTSPLGGFGSGLFTQQQNDQPTTSSFNFGSPSTSSMFGQQLNNSQSSHLSPNFGAVTPTGTYIKFNPQFGTDTLQKGSMTVSINTKFHNITCMAAYNGKSVEELRWEDYQSGRKGPQEQSTTEYRSTFAQPTTSGVTNAGFAASTPPNQQPSFSTPFCFFGATPTSNSFTSSPATPTFGLTTSAKSFTMPTKIPFTTPTPASPSFQFGNTTFSSISPRSTQNISTAVVNNPNASFGGQPLPLPTVGPQTAPQASLIQPFKASPGFPAFEFNFAQPPKLPTQPPPVPFNYFTKPTQPALNQPAPTNFGMGTQINPLSGTGRPIFGATNPNAPLSSSMGFVGSFHQPQATGANVNPFGNFNSSPTELLQSNRHYSSVDQIFDAFPHRDFFEDVPVKNYMHKEATNPAVLKAILEEPQRTIFPPCTHTIDSLRCTPKSFEGNHTKFALLRNEVDPFKEHPFPNRCSNKRLTLTKTTPQKNSMVLAEDNKGIKNETGRLRLENLLRGKIETSKNRDDISKAEDKRTALGATQTQTDKVFWKEDDNNNFPKVTHEDQSNNNLDSNNFTSKSDYGQPKPTPAPQKASDLDTVINRCGLKLTRDDYYTVPPFSEMHKYLTKTGACIVKGFTIGRLGYGNIYYPDPIDISNLDLDDLVEFRFREVTVYSDDDKRPHVGQGLNRPAQVTLDNVWPRHPKTKEVVKDLDELEKIDFSNRLRLLSKNQGATFLDYRVSTGSWVFAVEHFSGFHFSDADDAKAGDN